MRNAKLNDFPYLLHEYDEPHNTALITMKYRIHLIYFRVTSFNNGVSLFSIFSMAAWLRPILVEIGLNYSDICSRDGSRQSRAACGHRSSPAPREKVTECADPEVLRDKFKLRKEKRYEAKSIVVDSSIGVSVH